MTYNPSLARFKADMKDIRNHARRGSHQRLLATADEIAGNMKEAAAKDRGNLAASVRVIDNTRETAGSRTVSVKIRAGGALTQRRTAAGEVYDYAAANEFGTRDMPAQPFFYPTFRRYTAGNRVAREVAETVEQAIERNRDIVSRRANPSIGSSRDSGVVTKTQRG